MRQIRHYLIRALAWIVIAVALWFTADWVMMADRGIDLSDESLYLLEASASQTDAAYVFPFGWHTGPLFSLVGYEIRSFRVSGAVVLGLVGIWVGLSVARLVGATHKTSDPVLTLFAGSAGLASAWMFYFTLLRSPGYNWVTLVGIGVAVGAAVRQWAQYLDGEEKTKRWQSRLLLTFLGFGVVFTLAAKPTTPIFIGVTYGVTAFAVVGIRQATKALAWLVAAAFTWIAILVIIGWWPLNFAEVFWEATQRPLVSDNQSPRQALINFASIPLLAYTDFRGAAALPVFVIGGSLLALLSNMIRPWRYSILLLVPFGIVLLTAPIFASNSLTLVQQGWHRANLTVAFLLVVAASLLFGLGNPNRNQQVTRIQAVVSVASLVTLAGAFGFSSTNTPYPLMKFAALMLAAAALLPLVRVSSILHRRVVSGLIATSIILTTTSLLIRSQSNPYGSTNLAVQQNVVTMGRIPSQILVETETARSVSAIRNVVQSAGGSDIHLIPIGPDTPGMALAAGATLPKSIMLSWFGLPGDVALAQANLSRLDTPQWCDAWLLTHPLRGQTATIAQIFAHFTGRQWPADYKRELVVGQFSLWSPNEGCPNDLSSSARSHNYDSHS